MATAQEQLKALLDSKNASSHFNRAWGLVRQAAFETHPEAVLAGNFSEQGIKEMMAIVEAYKAEVDAEMQAQQKINDAIYEYESASAWSDHEYDELDSYMIVFADRIEFVANVKGYGSKLPKQGRKYIGSYDDIRWQFPLSQLQVIKPFAQMVFDEKGDRYSG